MKDRSIFEQDDSFSELMKKAKRKSIKRNIIISLFVSISVLVVLWLLLYIGQHFMYERMYEDAEETNDYYHMYGANVYPNGASYDYFFVAGRSNASTYKKVNGHLINWDFKSNFHTILGTKASINTAVLIDRNDSTYKNNYKMVNFHLPNEKTIHDDLSYLKTLPDFYSVEVALSFHEEMTLSEVNKVFPEASWVWLLQDHLYRNASSLKEIYQDNTLSVKRDFSEVDGDHALGFSVEANKAFKKGAKQYITFLEERSDSLAGAKEALQMLKQPDLDQIPVAGVILTGTAEEVLPYATKAPVRVVRTGVIIPY